jgi:hypothetical protein
MSDLDDLSGPADDIFDAPAQDPGCFGTPGPDPAAFEQFDTGTDGLVDLLVQAQSDGSLLAVHDSNGDLLADTLGVDFNNDGVYELIVVEEDGGYRVYLDQDSDGTPEGDVFMTREEMLAADAGVVAALDMQFHGTSAEPAQGDAGTDGTEGAGADGWVSDGALVGDPSGDAEHWFQQAANGFCVPASVAQIVSEYTGLHFEDEQYFVERANELHLFVVGPDGVPGIAVDGALALLEDAGVPASIEFGTGIESLVSYLEEGRRVVLAIDSGEIWEGETVEDEAADHAIVVTGVDLERGVVIVSDPGDPNGNAMEYPIDTFADAWADSGYAAVVCDVTPEEFAATEAAAVGAATGGESGLGAAADLSAAPTGGSAAVSWALEHSWAVLPVLLGARLIAGAAARK